VFRSSATTLTPGNAFVEPRFQAKKSSEYPLF
jgi:hypothetical protein